MVGLGEELDRALEGEDGEDIWIGSRRQVKSHWGQGLTVGEWQEA